MAGLFVLFPVVGGTLAFTSWKSRKHVIELLSQGRLMQGTVVSVRKSRTRSQTRTRSGRHVTSTLRKARITVAVDGGDTATFTTYKKSAYRLARLVKAQSGALDLLVHPDASDVVLAPVMMISSRHISAAREAESLEGMRL